MADTTYRPAEPAGNTTHGAINNGIVSAVAADDQVRILAVLADQGGSAPLGDIASALTDHTAPIGAILAMVDAGALTCRIRGLLDHNTIVERVDETDEPESSTAPFAAVVSSSNSSAAAAIQPALFTAEVMKVQSRGRQARDCRMLQAPGVYIALWDTGRIYVGMSEKLSSRISSGAHLSGPPPEQIYAIVDRNGALTAQDARVAERVLHTLVVHAEDWQDINPLPAGGIVDPKRYEQVRSFVIAAALQLRWAQILFTDGDLQNLFSLPASTVDAPIVHSAGTSASVLELKAVGTHAQALRDGDDWILLGGSIVRRDPVTSAGGMPFVRRAEYLAAGILKPLDDTSLLLGANIRFASGSAATQFAAGSKGVGPRSWAPIVQ